MSIATQITRINTAKAGIKEVVNQDFEIIDDETITYYPEKIAETIEEYKKYIPKNTVEGTELDINDAAPISGKIAVKGNTYQKSRILPEGYTQVDYIQSHGREYIDTGINADSNLRTILDMTYDEPTGSNQNVGAINIGNNQLRYHILPQNGYIKMFIQNTSYGLNTIAIDTNRHLYDIDVPNHIIKVDKNEYILNNDEFDVQLNFWLFARNSDSTIYKSKNKLYKCKMYVSGILVRDFIPCYRNSDNEVGLYDLVNDVFYTNDGNDAFTYGSVVDIPYPEYPQEIRVVTGNNVIKHVGKNLFNSVIEQGAYAADGSKFNSTTQIRTADFIKIKPNTSYVFSNTNNLIIDRICYYDENYNFIERGEYINNSNFTTLNNNCKYIRFNIKKQNGVSNEIVPSELINPQLEEGTTATATPYEPYKEKDYNLNLGTIELCKIGDYQDILFKNVVGDENYNAELEEGVWYKKKVIEKIQITKDTTIVPEIDTALAKTNRFLFRNLQPTGNKLKGTEISNFFKYSSNWSQDVVGFYLGDVNRNFVMRLPKSLPATWDELKTYLSDTPIVVYYILPNPTYSQITDTTLISQLEALRKAKWFKGVNHWWTETENLEPALEGTYKQELSGSEVP